MAADPVLLLVLLAGSVMPTAQNLVRRQRDATSMAFPRCSPWRKAQQAHPCLADVNRITAPLLQIVLLQLSARTQPLAPVLARMLLKLYAYSILPVSLWISGWATWLGVQVLC